MCALSPHEKGNTCLTKLLGLLSNEKIQNELTSIGDDKMATTADSPLNLKFPSCSVHMGGGREGGERVCATQVFKSRVNRMDFFL